jgi:segregation and condensation protein B
MTTGFTDDAGDGATNDDLAGDSRAVDGTDDADAIGLGSVRDHVPDDSMIQDDALDGDVLDDGAAHGDMLGGGAADDHAVDGAGDEDVDRDGAGDAAPAADVNGGDEADIDEADIEQIDGPGVRASLEAILLVADEPVPEVLLAQVLERPRGEIDAALRALAAEYTADGRGFDLREIAGGWRFYTREDCAPLVERFVRDGQEVRLTQAALETLAVIAYRQPVSRARVSAVRGVNCDGVIRTLVLRGLVEDSGTDQETGAILYRTTGYFLERLGMASLDELPDLAPFLPENIEDIEDNERTRA